MKKQCKEQGLDFDLFSEQYGFKEKNKEEYVKTYSFSETIDISIKMEKIQSRIKREIRLKNLASEPTQESITSIIEKKYPETAERTNEYAYNSLARFEKLLEQEELLNQEETPKRRR